MRIFNEEEERKEWEKNDNIVNWVFLISLATMAGIMGGLLIYAVIK
jgi:hypothetical protein